MLRTADLTRLDSPPQVGASILANPAGATFEGVFVARNLSIASERGRFTEEELARREAIAQRFPGVEFQRQHGNSGTCVCGHGCRYGECRELHVWFSAQDRGTPFNEQLALRIEHALEAK